MLHSLLLSLVGLTFLSHPGQGDGKALGHDPGHEDAEFAVAGSFSVQTGYPNAVIPVSEELCIIDLPVTFTLAGDMDGSFSSDMVIEHYGPCDQPAVESFSTSGLWSGEILGLEGSFEFSFGGHITLDHQASGILLIDDETGSGALEGLEGWVVLEGQAGISGDYEGELELK